MPVNSISIISYGEKSFWNFCIICFSSSELCSPHSHVLSLHHPWMSELLSPHLLLFTPPSPLPTSPTPVKCFCAPWLCDGGYLSADSMPRSGNGNLSFHGNFIIVLDGVQAPLDVLALLMSKETRMKWGEVEGVHMVPYALSRKAVTLVFWETVFLLFLSLLLFKKNYLFIFSFFFKCYFWSSYIQHASPFCSPPSSLTTKVIVACLGRVRRPYWRQCASITACYKCE